MEFLMKVLVEVSFFSIACGNLWEISESYKSLIAEAERQLESDIEDLASNGITSPVEINYFLKRLVCRFYAGIFHLIMQNRAANEPLDPEGNFKWAPVKKKLASAKSDLRMIKEYMEVHVRRNPGLNFSLGNAVTNLDQAIGCVNHILVTHSNMSKI